MSKPPPDPTFEARLRRRDTGCLEWTGYRNPKGYGQLTRKGKRHYAHKYAYWLAHGGKPAVLLHSCDNPPCCEVTHLKPGTRRRNNREMAERRRAARGEANGNSTLTSAQVTEIRQLLRSGWWTQREIAIQVGVAQSTVSRISTGHTWVS